MSGSPMSPGSYVSSESAAESAGSSNSIDDTEIVYGKLYQITSFLYKMWFLNITLLARV